MGFWRQRRSDDSTPGAGVAAWDGVGGIQQGGKWLEGHRASAVDVDIICGLRTEDGCPLEPRIRQLHPIPFSQVPIPFLTHFDSYHFSFYLYSEFPIFPLPNPFPIHFYSSSDPPYSKLTPHSTPYPGLAKARSAIPKSSNQ